MLRHDINGVAGRISFIRDNLIICQCSDTAFGIVVIQIETKVPGFGHLSPDHYTLFLIIFPAIPEINGILVGIIKEGWIVTGIGLLPGDVLPNGSY
jgi:hypothetical protein